MLATLPLVGCGAMFHAQTFPPEPLDAARLPALRADLGRALRDRDIALADHVWWLLNPGNNRTLDAVRGTFWTNNGRYDAEQELANGICEASVEAFTFLDANLPPDAAAALRLEAVGRYKDRQQLGICIVPPALKAAMRVEPTPAPGDGWAALTPASGPLWFGFGRLYTTEHDGRLVAYGQYLSDTGAAVRWKEVQIQEHYGTVTARTVQRSEHETESHLDEGRLLITTQAGIPRSVDGVLATPVRKTKLALTLDVDRQPRKPSVLEVEVIAAGPHGLNSADFVWVSWADRTSYARTRLVQWRASVCPVEPDDEDCAGYPADGDLPVAAPPTPPGG